MKSDVVVTAAKTLHGVVALLVASVILGGIAGPIAASSGGATGDMSQVDTPTPGDNTTRHEDPRGVRSEGDLSSVRSWLAGRLATRLSDCIVAVGNRNLDVCALDGKYPEWLSLYVDVVEDTETEADDSLGHQYQTAGERAEAFSTSTDSFRRTYAAYREARAAGNESRARELARTLQRDAAAVQSTARELNTTIEVIEAESSVDFSDAQKAIAETRANITSILDRVEDEQFQETTLRVSVGPNEISFINPATVTGRLLSENGLPIASRSIQLQVGGRFLETKTDRNGQFTLSYRPTTIPLGTEILTIRYQPRDESIYLSSEATAPVSITQVSPTVTVGMSNRQAAFAEEVSIGGQVAVDGRGVPGVPVVVTLDGRRIQRVKTDSKGDFSVLAVIAASDGPGEVTVTADVALVDRALAGTNSSVTGNIDTTDTTLTLDVSPEDSDTLAIDGRLTTAAGLGVPIQPVAVRVNGTPIETIRTREDGTFGGRVDMPTQQGGPGQVAVEVVYSGSGTNLEPARAAVVVTLPAPDEQPVESTDDDGSFLSRAVGVLQRPVGPGSGSPPLWQLVGGLVLIAAVGIGVALWRRSTRSDSQRSTVDPAAETSDRQSSVSVDPLDIARAHVASNADEAVMLAYGIVREELEAGGMSPVEAVTHWEFLEACRADGLDERSSEALTKLTEAYERAAYAPTALSSDDAQDAIEIAKRLV